MTGRAAIAPRLLRAWRLTHYLAAGVTIRIGRRVPDALFPPGAATEAILVTAWNPLSRRRPEAWNRRMQQRLSQRLRRAPVIEAEGVLHRWREAMLLVPGDPRPTARLARCFGQHAVVVLRRGQRARLDVLHYTCVNPARLNVHGVTPLVVSTPITVPPPVKEPSPL